MARPRRHPHRAPGRLPSFHCGFERGLDAFGGVEALGAADLRPHFARRCGFIEGCREWAGRGRLVEHAAGIAAGIARGEHGDADVERGFEGRRFRRLGRACRDQSGERSQKGRCMHRPHKRGEPPWSRRPVSSSHHSSGSGGIQSAKCRVSSWKKAQNCSNTAGRFSARNSGARKKYSTHTAKNSAGLVVA